MSRTPPDQKLGTWRWFCWAAAGGLFLAGSWVGLTRDPAVGITCWIASGVLAFIPFLAHRAYL